MADGVDVPMQTNRPQSTSILTTPHFGEEENSENQLQTLQITDTSMAGYIPDFPVFDIDVDKQNAGPRWKRWLGRLENLFVGMDIKEDERKRALLLHYSGESVYRIYEAIKGQSGETYTDTKKVLSDYFEPRKNVHAEVYNFRSCKQKSGQSLDEYVTELRQLTRACEFADNDKEILAQVIQNCSSQRLRRRALRETGKTLTDILDLGRSLEMSDVQAAQMERDEVHHNVNRISKEMNVKHKKREFKKDNHKFKTKDQGKDCLRCGGKCPHKNV